MDLVACTLLPQFFDCVLFSPEPRARKIGGEVRDCEFEGGEHAANGVLIEGASTVKVERNNMRYVSTGVRVGEGATAHIEGNRFDKFHDAAVFIDEKAREAVLVANTITDGMSRSESVKGTPRLAPPSPPPGASAAPKRKSAADPEPISEASGRAERKCKTCGVAGHQKNNLKVLK